MRINTRAKHCLVDIENEKSEIFRVLEVFRLFDLFETKRICLTAPKLWDDPYEDFLKHSYGMSSENKDLRISFEGYSNYIFGQCWTLSEETDALWRIYSPNRDRVQIKTTIVKLQEKIKKIQDKWFRSYIGMVKYLPEHEIKKKISDGIKNSDKYFLITDRLIKEYYLIKRDTFKYENEIRLLVILPEPQEKYKNAIYQDPDNLDICTLPIDDPIELIDEIVFDPRMPDSLVKAYTSYLRNNFNFSKDVYKSGIYSTPEIKEIVEFKY